MRVRWGILGAAAAAAGAWYAHDTVAHRRDGMRGYTIDAPPPVGSERFARAAEALTQAPISRGNTAEVLINGDRIFPAFLDAIAGARHSVNLLTYVYWRGDIGRRIAEALCERARAGVTCRVLLDAVGAMPMEDGLIDRLTECGVEVHRFRPLRPYALHKIDNRTHRKVLVVDGEVGLTGGVGIADEWTGDAQDPDHWRDTHLRVRGPVVRGLLGAFAENWLEATGEVIASAHDLPALNPVDVTGDGDAEEPALMQVIRSSAGVGDTNVETLFFLALAAARERVDLTSAYFAPRPAFVQALVDAADRGVHVRVLVPGRHIDKSVVRHAGRARYGELLSAGVRMFEYAPTMLHAKCLVVDDVWSAVGSANFDNRSFRLNDEALICIRDAGVAEALTGSFAADLEVSHEVTLSEWRSRPPSERLRELASRVVNREL